MMFAAVLLVVVAAVSVAAARARATRRAVNEVWSAAARELRLPFSPVTFWASARIEGGRLSIVGTEGRNATTVFEFAGLPWDLSFGGRFGFTRVPVGDRE